MPDVKDKFISLERGVDNSALMRGKIFPGILKGPVDLLESRIEMQSRTSESSVGERKIESETGFVKNEEKCLEVKGILFLILSAMDVK